MSAFYAFLTSNRTHNRKQLKTQQASDTAFDELHFFYFMKLVRLEMGHLILQAVIQVGYDRCPNSVDQGEVLFCHWYEWQG